MVKLRVARCLTPPHLQCWASPTDPREAAPQGLLSALASTQDGVS